MVFLWFPMKPTMACHNAPAPLGRPTSHRQRCRDQSEGSLRPGIIQGFHCGSICHYVISTRWWHMIAGHSWSFFTCRYLRSTQSWASRKNRENHLFQDSEILCQFGNPSCGPSGPTNFIGDSAPQKLPKAALARLAGPRAEPGLDHTRLVEERVTSLVVQGAMLPRATSTTETGEVGK